MTTPSQTLPFLTREMLAWGPTARWDIEVVVTTAEVIALSVSGATKEAPFTFSVQPTGNIDRESHTFSLVDIPIFLSVHTSNSNYNPGEIWVEVFLRANSTRLHKLCSGYVSPERSISYPDTGGVQPWQEGAPPFFFTISNPSAGANLDTGPSSSQYWVVHQVAFRLVTDANVANRRVHLRVRDNGSVLMGEWWGNTDQAASTTRDYVFSATGAVQSETDNNIIAVAIPGPIYVPRTTDLESSITNIQAGDQISNVRILRSDMAMDV